MVIRAVEIADGLVITKQRFGRSGGHNDHCSRAFGICLLLAWVVGVERILLAGQLTFGEEW